MEQGRRQEEVGTGHVRRKGHVVHVADTEQRPDVRIVRVGMSGSTKKKTARIRPSATMAAICASPPMGPERTDSTSSPTFSRSRAPVVRVATISKSARRSRL
jgi:hypothetical protein